MTSNSSRLRFNPIFENIKDIKEFLHKIPMWRFFMSPIKKKCQDVKNKISCIEDELKKFSEFNQSLHNCHVLKLEVFHAKKQVNQAILVISSRRDYKRMATRDTENSYVEICSNININLLKVPNNSESYRGELNSLIKLIRDKIEDLKSCREDNLKMVIDLFNNIETHYTDIEIVISKIIANILIG